MTELKEGRKVRAIQGALTGRLLIPGAVVSMEAGQGGYVPWIRWHQDGAVRMFNCALLESIEPEVADG